ncbi:hypothetical protein DFH08DRAFT_447754 [Mycena albidolilacea]|uniref:DUF6534 domain-containing protein n=1 Tax=Mycena albidolilacea TaxID=1033008 RepID=A0AAD7ECM6_9AGAR|nr:hypothetical protein DFH08DRAFT_447754 [Mycena albidolilacea]
MSSPLDETYGLWLIVFFLESVLFGAGLLQTHLYFLWYPKDNWIVKATVLAVVLFETMQTVIFFAGIHFTLIEHFGDFANLAIISWHVGIQLLFLYLTGFVAQAYYAQCLYRLHSRDKILPVIIFICTVLSFIAGIAQVVLIFDIGDSTASDRGHQVATNAQAALNFLTDLLITVGLSWRMNKNRSGIQSTNKLINFLIIAAINRGVLTMVMAALALILNLAAPTTFWFHVALILNGKFYMNSLLAMLNTRQYALGTSREVSMNTMGGANDTNNGFGRNLITINHETRRDVDVEPGKFSL